MIGAVITVDVAVDLRPADGHPRGLPAWIRLGVRVEAYEPKRRSFTGRMIPAVIRIEFHSADVVCDETLGVVLDWMAGGIMRHRVRFDSVVLAEYERRFVGGWS